MVHSKTVNVRTMLLSLKMPSFLIDMAIPFMWFTPGAVDPDSPSVIEIIKGLQRGLLKLGSRVRVSGVLDNATAKGLDEIAGTEGEWMQKTWVQIYGDVLEAMDNPGRKAHKMRAAGLGSYFEYDGPAPGPLPGWRVGLPPGPLGMYQDLGATAIDGGVELEFGRGTKDTNVIVPIPKSSGPTLTAFKNLQRQINRLLSLKGKRINEDGLIGAGTFKAFQTVQDAIGVSVPGDETTGTMAAHAITIANTLDQQATARNIPANANQGATTSSAASRAVAVAPMSAAQAAAFTGGTGGGGGGDVMDALKKYLPFLLLAGGIAFFAAKSRKSKGGEI
jgi:hypothetical protein